MEVLIQKMDQTKDKLKCMAGLTGGPGCPIGPIGPIGPEIPCVPCSPWKIHGKFCLYVFLIKVSIQTYFFKNQLIFLNFPKGNNA